MKATDLHTLRALLAAGDAPGALAYLDACAARPRATGAAPEPMPRPTPKYPKLNRINLTGFQRTGGKITGILSTWKVDRKLGPPPRPTAAVCPWIIPAPLAVAPCRCTTYPDQGVLCPAHEAARDIGPCAALIKQECAAGRIPYPVRNPAAFIFQSACRYAY